jgi:SNF family Na+-dependent transporter
MTLVLTRNYSLRRYKLHIYFNMFICILGWLIMPYAEIKTLLLLIQGRIADNFDKTIYIVWLVLFPFLLYCFSIYINYLNKERKRLKEFKNENSDRC